VLELSADGGIWQDAGAWVLEGGYAGTIALSQANPLAGRDAWTGDLGGWQQVVVDLSSFAGADLALRWRFATDASVGAEGWYVDDVTVMAERTVCEPVESQLPGEPSAPGETSRPLRLGKSRDGFTLTWDAPTGGGPVTDYVLYAAPTAAPWSEPACEALLGGGTSAVIPWLPADSAFVVVARNEAGEGPYGTGSEGLPRTPATTSTCP
jgi:hypothetical protein